ncbi:MAG: hypothetical protein J6I49_08160 [Bacteroidales bacterium]|nr:hypothetical protein [Bacteroidales bacterium]
MKRILLIAAMLFGMGTAAMAQVELTDSTRRAIPADSIAVDDDEEDDGPNVIGAQPMPSRPKGEANVLGVPVYYDREGNVRGSHQAPAHRRGQSPQGVYRMPEHHYRNNVGFNFNSCFFEVETLIGTRDAALGASFTYLPERWGVYGSALGGVHRNYFSVGPALRLSGRESALDWHLYGGALFSGRRTGGEVGLRIASQAGSSKFCWTSASMGMAFLNNQTYLTIGLSLEVAALSALTFFFW